MVLKTGVVEIELFKDIAPNHVERIIKLTESGQYDGVAFHRVIDDFMAQTGDVQYGNAEYFDKVRVGTGGSRLLDLKAEFNGIPHERGIVSMARSQGPNSANSQFFICLKDSLFLDKQYTVFGMVIDGMEFIDKIKKGTVPNGKVEGHPDFIISMEVIQK